MLRKYLFVVLLCCLILLLLLPGCRPENEKTIKIGAIYPLSGSLSEIGSEICNALEFSADVINRRYDLNLPLAFSEGIGSLRDRRIELVFADSRSLETVACSEALRLIKEEKVVALIGCYQSAITTVVSQVAEEEGIPFICDISTAPSLTQRGYEWFFRTSPDDEAFVKSYFDFLTQSLLQNAIAAPKVAIVYEDSIWGTEFAAYVQQYADLAGYNVVENIAYSSSSNEVNPEVKKLKQFSPDIIFQASYTGDAISFMQAYKQQAFNPSAILTVGAGFDDITFIETLGDDADYVFSREVWAADWAATRPLAERVKRLFNERCGMEMTSDSARAFTGLSVLGDALSRSASTRPEDIRSALISTYIPSGMTIMPWGGVKFDEQTHQNILAENLICQMIHGQYRTVWPSDRATDQAIWPVPEWSVRDLFRVAMVFDSPVADDSFCRACLRGMEKAKLEMGAGLDFSESGSEPETELLIRRLTGDYQHDLIICIGASQSEALKRVFQDYPRQRFVLVDGDIADRDNIISLLARDQESSFLLGALAALNTRTGSIGFIGGMDLPSIQRFLAGYRAGARYIRADCEVLVDYSGTWLNNGVTRDLALKQHRQGADVIYAPAGAGSMGMIEVAREEGFYALGVDSDQSYAAPGNVLASAVKNMDVMVYDLIMAEYRGDEAGGIVTSGLKEGGVGIVFNPLLVSQEITAKIKEIEEGIVKGTIIIPGQ
ncbi:MAG: BMP family ABC transporter substrate-binding protein [Dehalococcoidales bacterium]|nr:BMP family ABC transporter substrate-binding protein [Dehalococcoidales bacterium]